MEQNFSEQELLRRESLAKIRELGIDPYPAALYPVNASAQSIADGFDPEKNNMQDVCLAGRLMSRAVAKAKLSMEEYRSSMAGIYTTSVLPDTLDESPMAYKSLADIIDVIRDTVDILDVMKPVYNFKASE